jgi:hypothetical protein
MSYAKSSILHPDQTDAALAGSAVSWGAVLAGAAIAAALSAMLITAGTGLGFLAVSPWHDTGLSGSAVAVGSIVWLLVTQIIAYGVAGYVTGRLRTKWTDAVKDEVYFRDTAHGFLVWALSAIVGFFLLGSTAASMVSGTTKAGADIAGASVGTAAAVATGMSTNSNGLSLDYLTDALLRPNDPASSNNPDNAQQEVSHLVARIVVNGGLSNDDQSYLVKLIARRAGVDDATATQRIRQIQEQVKQTTRLAEQKAREAADAARKVAAAFSLWAFASLLIGAFVASLAATVGGNARDR